MRVSPALTRLRAVPDSAKPVSQVTVASPAKVIASEAMTCTAISVSAQPVRAPRRSPTTSAENVEKVVRPPQNPVMIISRHSGGRAG